MLAGSKHTLHSRALISIHRQLGAIRKVDRHAWNGGRKLSPDLGHPKECQWIEGEPTCDDSCKCLVATVPGKSYCEEHQKRAYVVKPVKEDE